MYVLNNEVLRKAFHCVVNQEDFGAKMQWWMLSPHAAERWIQFELAYQLNKQFNRSYLVACEVGVPSNVGGRTNADFAIFSGDARSPLWKNHVQFAMELKVLGNWHIAATQVEAVRKDFLKVDRYRAPSLVLVFGIEATMSPSSDLYDWCREQIKTIGAPFLADSKLKVLEKLGLHHFEDINASLADNSVLAGLKVHLYVYRNALAADF